METEDNLLDDNVHSGCYIFTPAATDVPEDDQQPRKRRKLNSSDTNDVRPRSLESAWPSLLGGQEPDEARASRQRGFHTWWARQQAKIDEIANAVDDQFVDEVLQFMRCPRARREARQDRLTTGLIVSRPGGKNAHDDLIRGWNARRSRETATGHTSAELLVQLQSTHSPSLPSVLKNLIRTAICGHRGGECGLEEYTAFLNLHKALIPWNFDLELLQRYVEVNSIARVMVSIPEVETFDTTILSELIRMLNSFSDRIPFIFLIGVSTSVDLLESRLSRSTVSLLMTQVFEPRLGLSQADLFYDIYRSVQHDTDSQTFLGPSVVAVLADMADDQSTTLSTFTMAIKYAYMAHFFANPLSALSPDPTSTISQNVAVCRAIRNTSSFRAQCERLATGGKDGRQQARALLSSDETLEVQCSAAIRTGVSSWRRCLQAVHTLQTLAQHLPRPDLPQSPPLQVQSQLLASLPDLTQTDVFDAVETRLKECETVGDLRIFLAAVWSMFDDLQTYTPDLSLNHIFRDTGILSLDEITKTLSTFDDNHLLAAIDPPPSATFLALLTNYLTEKTSDLSNLNVSASLTRTGPPQAFMSEVFIVNTKAPLAQTIHPRPRYALERALTCPADYLGCDCCASRRSSQGGAANRAQLPHTSLLLNMLNEAGAVINVKDLWDTFHDAVASQSDRTGGKGMESDEVAAATKPGDAKVDDAIVTDHTALALFSQSLADLRYLGLVRPSKRKPGVDCIAKTAWMNL